jgi:hypothetical protein
MNTPYRTTIYQCTCLGPNNKITTPQSKNDEPGCFLLISYLLIGWLLIPICLWVVNILWDWYIISAFPNIPTVSIRLLFGICLIYEILFRKKDFSGFEKDAAKKYNTAYFVKSAMYKLSVPIFILLIGWLFKP